MHEWGPWSREELRCTTSDACKYGGAHDGSGVMEVQE